MAEEYKNLVKLEQLATFKRLADETYTNKKELDSYYTKEQADEKFISAHQSLEEYQKTADADAKYATIVEDEKKLMISSFNDYSAKLDVEIDTKVPYSAMTAYQPKGDYVSATDVSYISGVVDNKVNRQAYEEFTASLPETYLTKESADTLYQPTGDYATNTEVNKKLYTSAFNEYSASLPSTYLTKESADTLYQPIGDYATNDKVTYVSGEVDKKLVKSDFDTYSASLPSTYLTKESADTLYQPTGNYVSSTQLADYYTTAQADAKFLTAHQSLEEYLTTADAQATYATKEDNNKKLDTTDFNTYTAGIREELDDVVTNEELEETLEEYQPKGDYALDSDLEYVSGEANKKLYTSAFNTYSASLPSTYFTKESADTLYQSLEGMTAYQVTGDYATNTNLNYVSGEVDNKLFISSFNTYSSDLQTALFTKASADTLYQPIGDYVTSTELNKYYDKTASDGKYLTQTSADTIYTKLEDMSLYQTKADMVNYATELEMQSANHQISAIQNIIHSDDETLDTIQEIVDFAKHNKDLIDGILTNKQDKSAMNSYYTKNEANDLYNGKVDTTTYETFTGTTLPNDYYKKTEVYSITEADETFVAHEQISIATDAQISAMFGFTTEENA
ncbi:MAG: hypothetical protein MJZ34_08145 [Paludibacteraceae bacterium]|nr:hypothetical protein [Paludibacteraceae bacterium]